MNYQHYTVDVFTRDPYSGAQISVFPEAAGLSEAQMQVLARELSHSETVFVRPPIEPGTQAELLVFSPLGERDFGSHTTVAAARALVHCGLIDVAAGRQLLHFTQGARRLEVFVHADSKGEPLIQLSLEVEPVVDRFVPETADLQRALGLGDEDVERFQANSLLVSCGVPYLVVPLRSLDAVYRARFNTEAWVQSRSAVPVGGVLVYSRECEAEQSDFHLRLLGPQLAVQDDPPVGGAVPAFAAYLCEQAGTPEGTHSLCLERGRSMTRQSLLKVEFDYRRLGGPAFAGGWRCCGGGTR